MFGFVDSRRFVTLWPAPLRPSREPFLFFDRLLILLAILAFLLTLLAPAHAGNTSFLTERNGQVVFPFSPPNRATPAPGTIDNMSIGATTPAPGNFSTLSVGGNAGITCPTFMVVNGLTLTGATDSAFFVATRSFLLVSVSEIHAVAAGGASLLQVTKDTGTNAPGAGTDLLTNNTNTGFDLNATANTVQAGTLVAAATRTLAAGDRLSVDFSGAIQSSANVVVTACLQPL